MTMFQFCRSCEPHLAAAAEEFDQDVEIVDECPRCQLEASDV